MAALYRVRDMVMEEDETDESTENQPERLMI